MPPPFISCASLLVRLDRLESQLKVEQGKARASAMQLSQLNDKQMKLAMSNVEMEEKIAKLEAIIARQEQTISKQMQVRPQRVSGWCHAIL